MTTLYHSIAEILRNTQQRAYSAVNLSMIDAYWHIGQKIVEEEQQGNERAKYGDNLLQRLSQELSDEFGKGFNLTNLKYIRQFYLAFPIRHALRGELSWTHYRLLLKVQNEKARQYYLQEAIDNQWSTRILERQINSLYYERLLASQDKKSLLVEAQKSEKLSAQDIIKDPFVLEFLNLKSNHAFSEQALETALIDKLQDFLLELGKGFSFVARQKRFTADNEHFYVDLVFYNYLLKCFVLIDLKVGKLSYQDIGQIDFYVRYWEEHFKTEGDNPTIGIILCTEKNETIVKYSVLEGSQQLFASKYQLYLPTEEELRMELEREKRLIESEKSFQQNE
ncbi:YhcG family protein [Flectobacillus sp. BAB-3569]|uniref:PDDEXK nuclease domain-containing protein n=1 Tax=Flectobacillus sp. BAB-3569 TaxID=1509483 RepID=UPI001595890A|nr:PDDEXK nuclease domain-containing protein [Flectobacillus sp. BAB-3569]